MQATPGEMKSFRSSADKMALIVLDLTEGIEEDQVESWETRIL